MTFLISLKTVLFDNTLSFKSPDFEEIIKVLQCEGKILID